MAGYIGTQAVSVNTTSATISDDLAVGDDLAVTGLATIGETLAVTGVVTANGGVVVDNFTLDGTTLALSSGDFTVDVAGDILLDAGGSDILLKVNGTTFGSLRENSSNFRIKSDVSDKDMLFLGNDGGAEITALTLDMSAAGEADFNNAIKVAGGIAAHQTNRGVFSFGSNSLLIRSYGASAGDGKIEFKVAGGGGSEDSLALTIEADKDVRIADGDLVIGTAGHGINFQAFGGGTGINSNLLDDYETGTVSLVMNGANDDPSTTVNVTGTYVKIGRLVSVRAQNLNLNNTGAVGPMQLSNFPFAANGAYGIGSIGEINDICTFTNTPYLVVSGTVGYVYQNISEANAATVSHHVDTAGAINIDVTYETNS